MANHGQCQFYQYDSIRIGDEQQPLKRLNFKEHRSITRGVRKIVLPFALKPHDGW
jgi:hypothetical protein